jgi:hypothetical protein
VKLLLTDTPYLFVSHLKTEQNISKIGKNKTGFKISNKNFKKDKIPETPI